MCARSPGYHRSRGTRISWACCAAAFTLVCLAYAPLPAQQIADRAPTGFYYPVSDSLAATAAESSFGLRDFEGYRPWGKWHCGADIEAGVDDPVWPIADGVVHKVSLDGWSESGKADNFGYIVEHLTSGNTRFFAVYGHLRRPASLRVGQVVYGGQTELGRIGKWYKTPHLHFGVYLPPVETPDYCPSEGYGRQPMPRGERQASSLGVSGYGPTNAGYANRGYWLDPIAFIRTQRPGGTTAHGGQPPHASSQSVLVIDVSGSMSQPMPKGQPKIDAVKDAVRDYLKTLEDDTSVNGTRHRVAAIAFSDEPSRLHDLTDNMAGIRQAVNRLEPLSMTNLGDSLEMAVAMLEQEPNAKDRTILFFSDGKTNAGAIPRDDFLIAYDPASGPRSDFFRDSKMRELYWRIHQAGIRVITIGFGDPAQSAGLQKYLILPGVEPDLDDQVLRSLAETPRTGGQYVNAQDYAGLLKSFVVAYNVSANRQLIAEETGTIAAGQTREISFDLTASAMRTGETFGLRNLVSLGFLCTPAFADGVRQRGQLLVTLGWDRGRLGLVLRDPAGVEVGPSYPGARMRSSESPINIFVDDPKRGRWSATVVAEDIPGDQAEYYFLASSQMPPLPPPGAAGGGGASPDWQTALLVSTLVVIFVLAVLCVTVLVRRRALEPPARQPFQPSCWLQVQQPGLPPRNVPMTGAILRIGRDPRNGLTLRDPKVSAHHAELRLYGGQVYVTDVRSTHGILVNGVRVSRRALRHGDRIALGDSRLVYLLPRRE